ncbi:DUF2306 domain-containing protein [Dactylosporangium sp. NPDC000555]|uniref:DUF2306 domain-containing protein n=1 Tax=Dactylosporangium sp. NPDC000555 TaxID=3154260 RepID=UPI00331F6992
MTTVTAPQRGHRRRDWPIIAGLLLLAFVPSAAGGLRVAELTGGAERTPGNARFVDMPVPVIIHIIGAVTFAVLGAFQLAPGLRARHRRWHRAAGRVLVVCGLAVAASGLWMTAFYPLPTTDNTALSVFRYVFGTAMFAALVLGFLAARRRDFRAHRAWMLRGYAIGMGAGTQALTSVPLFIALDEADPRYTPWRAVALLAGWLVNLGVAEWIIRSGRRRGR